MLQPIGISKDDLRVLAPHFARCMDNWLCEELRVKSYSMTRAQLCLELPESVPVIFQLLSRSAECLPENEEPQSHGNNIWDNVDARISLTWYQIGGIS